VSLAEAYPHRHLEDADVARLILGSAQGSASEAEAELYRRLAPRVRLYGLRHLKNDHAAQDLSHHVLLLTIEKLRAGQLARTGKDRIFRARNMSHGCPGLVERHRSTGETASGI
jgi:hypothetical protein